MAVAYVYAHLFDGSSYTKYNFCHKQYGKPHILAIRHLFRINDILHQNAVVPSPASNELGLPFASMYMYTHISVTAVAPKWYSGCSL